MKHVQKNQMIILGIIIWLFIMGVYVISKYDIFHIQHTSQSSSKTGLEKSRGLSEGDLQDIQGKIYLGPYRDLWKQRYTFFGMPKSFQFWLYNFTLDDAKRLLQERGVNGIRVQGIMESEQYASKDNQFAELHNGFNDNPNITILPDDRLGVEFQHAKTFLSDTSFIIQTANMTYSSFNKNRELFFMSFDTGVLLSLQNLFHNDRMGLPTAMDALHPNLIVCPINCRKHIESLLHSANSSIIMYQQYIADDSIQKILREKRDAGVDIKVILGDKGDAGEKRDQAFITAMSGSIKMQSNPYVHAKAILVDNQFLLVGSMNMSDTSLDKNREIGILLINRFQIEKFVKGFLKDRIK